MPRAVIFDFDGVIADSEEAHFLAHRNALKEVGIHLTKNHYIKHGVSGEATDFYQRLGVGKEKSIHVYKRKRELYEQELQSIRPMPHVRATVLELGKKYRLGVSSTTQRRIIIALLIKFRLRDCFKVIIGGDDVIKKKPSPDSYIKAVQELSVPLDECVVIEDSENGIKAAKAAGLFCIVVPNRFTQNQNLTGADVIVDDIQEITGLIAG